jgi:hypothetical protein
MEPSSQEETFQQQIHHPIVRIAAEALADGGIRVVEYGQHIEWRHGDPVVLMVSNKPAAFGTTLTCESQFVKWAVPDEIEFEEDRIKTKRVSC